MKITRKKYNFVKIFGHSYYLAIALLFAFTALSGKALAADNLKITIYNSQDDIPSKEVQCMIGEARNCSTTLLKAMHLVQEQRWQKLLEDLDLNAVQLVLKPATYRIREPLDLHWGDSKMRKVPLEIMPESGRVVISGAWSPVPPVIRVSDDSRIPKNAKGQVVEIFLGQIKYILHNPPPPRGYAIKSSPLLIETFYQDAAMPVAAWPNDDKFGKIKCSNKIACDDRKTFSVAYHPLQDWMDEPDLLAFAYWYRDIYDQTLRVKVDQMHNYLYFLDDDLDARVVNPYMREGQRLRVENALSELDAMGEWYVDRDKAILYLWAPGPVNTGDVEVSVAPNLLQIWGSHNILVRGIQFEKSRGPAITIKESDNVVIDKATIRMTGNQGVVVQGGQNCGVTSSLIEDVGEGGIFLKGGDRNFLVPSHHFARNNIIRRFNRFVKTYRPGVNLEGVGQIAQGNYIYDSTHSGIIFSGNDHRIIDNEISNVVLESYEAGAIYTGGDLAARGTLIANNYIHDIKAGYNPRNRNRAMGIFIDDAASGIAIRNNIFSKVDWPVHIGGGRDNSVNKNLFYRTGPAVTLDPYGLFAYRNSTFDPKDELKTQLGLVPYKSSAYAKYIHLQDIDDDDFGRPKYNAARDNVIVKLGFLPQDPAFQIESSSKSAIAIEGTRLVDEAIFANPSPAGGRKARKDFIMRRDVK